MSDTTDQTQVLGDKQIGAMEIKDYDSDLRADVSTVGAENGLVISPGRISTASLANVAASATNVTLKAANTGRRGLLVFNDADKVLDVKYGATASSSSFTVQIAAGGYWEMPQPVYTGIVDGIWAAGPTGSARITELT